MNGSNRIPRGAEQPDAGAGTPGDAVDVWAEAQASEDVTLHPPSCEERTLTLKRRFDWKLDKKGGLNTVLTLILRIYFQRVDPTDKGGDMYATRDANGTWFKLREITDHDFYAFQEYACRAANNLWNCLCLVTPNDFTKLDWPEGSTASVRPNVNCLLNCTYKTRWEDRHAWVGVVSPISPQPGVWFQNFCDVSRGGMGKWDIRGGGAPNGRQDFWEARLFPLLDLQSIQPMVGHEVGHLLGIAHAGVNLKVKVGANDVRRVYGTEIPWLGRDIMGAGSVVHACDARPWMDAMGAETCTEADRWIPAGVQIPPRPIQNIPKQPYTLRNSPYQGGFQEVGRY